MLTAQRIVRLLVLLFLLGTCSAWVAAQAPQGPKQLQQNAVAALIDKLPEIAEGGTGYLPTQTGSGFLPLGVSQADALVLGQPPPTRSDTLRELVKRGAAAVPHLLAHLDDKRPTKITLKFEGAFGGVMFNDEYDYNGRTTQQRPEGVNRWEHAADKHPNSHTVTVGDLCFVALGQIVNRRFNAVRYQPTAIIIINSPTYSAALRKAIQKEWGGLTPARHRESLVRDFNEADSEDRRNGACLRLGYYYPEALEPLALKQLAAPLYDVFAVHGLIREKLYRIKDTRERKALLDAFVAKHGDVARQGILLCLFGDLGTQEAGEAGNVSPPWKGEYDARACLIDLFGYPRKVKSKDCPLLFPVENCEQARFLDALAFFHSAKTDAAVRQLMQSTEEDYLARACARYLVGRGVDADIRKYVAKHLKGADKDRRQQLLRLLDQVGWTRLHVAAEAGNNDQIENLVRQGADINARAANGQTPLHVAAGCGSYGAIRLLLKLKANPNLKDKQGLAPVQVALGYDHAVEDLLAGGADVPDILVAAFAGRADLVRRFLEKNKAAAGARTYDDETPLHLAARRGHVKVAEVLLAFGADVNASSGSSKLTPLHWAASYSPQEMVALLLAHKADRKAKSWNDRTPLDFAKERGDEAIIRLLEKGP
jgi:ankyrin repeat protein